ncbi:Type I restriction endonuclease subunit R [Tumidithrix helvetica PCC 7403]|uniref:type I restriction endonuclease n=1 Tax=Tumidithrix helvetica TaxID=3457545 RepID=UPI003C9B0649
MTTIAVTDAIRSIAEIESRFRLSRSLDHDFFTEWQQDFEDLTQIEKVTLDRIKQSYLRHVSEGFLSEGMVNLLVVSPLLFLANFLDAPFSLRSEEAVEIVDQDRDITYKGRIDALVFKENIWIVLVEAKRSSFSFLVAVPQALTYMMASPNGDLPTYALVTNGDHFMFVKKHGSQYDLSDDFSLFKRSQNELYPVLQILKSLANI